MQGPASLFPKAVSAAPPGHRAYAVGDVHGRLDLLNELLGKISADNLGRPPAQTTIVFLGDLIDRGPQSAGVVERLRKYRPAFAKTVFLMGNHEEVLLRIVGGEAELLADWMKFGGAECMRSYGVDPADLQRLARSDAVALLRRTIPREHLKFIDSFADTAAFGDYLFVHAGIRPGIEVEKQVSQDLRWIRSPFLDDDRHHGPVVVHGHTISETVEVRANRIGLDTGAYSSGVLTAIGLEGEERWFIQTGGAAVRKSGDARVANFSDA